MWMSDVEFDAAKEDVQKREAEARGQEAQASSAARPVSDREPAGVRSQEDQAQDDNDGKKD